MNYRFGILIIILIACRSEESQLIERFDTLYENFLDQNFVEILGQLDDGSHILIDRLLNPINFNTDSLSKIGETYNIRYFCWRYYTSFGLDRFEREKSDFVRFMMIEQISIFNHDELMHLIEEKCKVSEESYVAFYYDVAGNKLLNWMRFTADGGDPYKLDLIYTLELNENSYGEIYQYQRKAANLGYDESFKWLYQQSDQIEEDVLAESRFWNQQTEKLRKERKSE